MSETEKLLIRMWDQVQNEGLQRVHIGHPEVDYLISVTINYAKFYNKRKE